MYRVIRMQGRFLHPNLYLELEGRQTNRNKFSPFRRLGGCRSFVKRSAQPERHGLSEDRTVVTECMIFAVFSIGIDSGRQRGYEAAVDLPAYGVGAESVGHRGYDDRPKSRYEEIVHHLFRRFPQSGSTISIPCGESCCSRYLRTSCRKISPKMKRVTPCVLKCSTARDMATS